MGNESSAYSESGSPPRPLSGRSRPLKSLSVDEACALLISLNVHDVSLFEERKVDGADLAEASEEDLEALGIDLRMKRKKLVKKLADLMWSGVPVELIGEDDLAVEYSPNTLTFGTPPRGSPNKRSDFGSPGSGFEFDPIGGIVQLFGGSSPRKKRVAKQRDDSRDGYLIEDLSTKTGVRLEDLMGPCETVDLAGKEITVADMPAIEAMLATNEGLRSLFLDMNNLGDSGINSLLDVLPLRPELQELYLSANGITDKGGKELAWWIRDSECTTLALSENKISDAGAVELAKAVCQSAHVQKIALDANDVGDKGVKCFAKQLKGNETLQMLDLSCARRRGSTLAPRALRAHARRSQPPRGACSASRPPAPNKQTRPLPVASGPILASARMQRSSWRSRGPPTRCEARSLTHATSCCETRRRVRTHAPERPADRMPPAASTSTEHTRWLPDCQPYALGASAGGCASWATGDGRVRRWCAFRCMPSGVIRRFGRRGPKHGPPVTGARHGTARPFAGSLNGQAS